MTLFVLRKGNDWIRDNALQFMRGLSPDKDWQVEIKPYRKKRSNPQNALYWKWVAEIASETGNDKDDVHDVLRDMFLTPRVVTMGEERREVRKSTTSLTTAEFTEYLERISAWAACEFAMKLPHPDDRWIEEAA